MLSRKTIATHVTNLTDARYFAARGIEYLLFDLDDVSIDQAVEIKEWVEGPEILLLFSDSSLRFLDEAVIKIRPKGIGAKSALVFSKINHLAAHTELFEWTYDTIILDNLVFSVVDNLSDLNHIDAQNGIIIKGGSEVLIGVKAFDDLDDILDFLED